MLIRFARKTGQPLRDVLEMDPRDFDTWMFQVDLEEREAATDARMAAKAEEHARDMGRR